MKLNRIEIVELLNMADILKTKLENSGMVSEANAADIIYNSLRNQLDEIVGA